MYSASSPKPEDFKNAFLDLNDLTHKTSKAIKGLNDNDHLPQDDSRHGPPPQESPFVVPDDVPQTPARPSPL